MTRLHAVDYGAAKALLEVNSTYVLVDINKSDVLEVHPEPTPLIAGAWMKVSADFDYPAVWRELAEASVAKLDVEEATEEPRERKFRVPDSVKREASQALTWATSFERGRSIVGEKLAERLAENTYVTMSDVQRIQRYFSRMSSTMTEMSGWNPGSEGYPTDERIRFAMRGGEASRAWVRKISAKHTITAAADGDKPHEFVPDPDDAQSCNICGRAPDAPVHALVASAFEYDETADYFGIGVDPDTTVVTALLMLSADGTWSERTGDMWTETDEPAETELLIMLDEDSAYKLASIIDDEVPENPNALPYELALLNPHEAALFHAADPELDYTLIDRLTFDIYDSTERSINAGKQVRGPGGKFGDEPDAADTEKQTVAETKARLTAPLPLVPDVAGRIQQYLAENGAAEAAPAAQDPAAPTANPAAPAGAPAPAAPVQAAGSELSSDYLNHLIELAEAAPAPAAAPVGGAEEQAPAAAPAGPRPLYLAIVDSVDTEAVLDVVSLMAGPPPVLWKRDKGQWVQAPEILAALQGTAPPPVVELTDDAIVKNVLDQVDASTTGQEAPEEEAPVTSEQAPNGAPVAPKPDANPDQHPVAASGGYGGLRPPTVSELKADEEKKKKRCIRRGYALADGSFAIENVSDLKHALSTYDSARNLQAVQRHITRRARGLGRIDLVPNDWRTAYTSDEYTMFGPYGELMKLTEFEGGADRNRGGAEKLRHYWTRGEGGLKIGWNTPGDMTRCMKFLAKYLRGREAGYCALRHKEMTGMWPGDRDNPGMEKD